MNEEEVDNTLVNSPRDSPEQNHAPTLMSVPIPTNISFEEEEEEQEESESDSLSPKLGFVITKPSAKVTITSMAKDSVQTFQTLFFMCTSFLYSKHAIDLQR